MVGSILTIISAVLAGVGESFADQSSEQFVNKDAILEFAVGWDSACDICHVITGGSSSSLWKDIQEIRYHCTGDGRISRDYRRYYLVSLTCLV